MVKCTPSPARNDLEQSASSRIDTYVTPRADSSLASTPSSALALSSQFLNTQGGPSQTTLMLRSEAAERIASTFFCTLVTPPTASLVPRLRNRVEPLGSW